ncbi:MAG: nitrous oxide reductase family maturation protein NosD [Flavobacteriaceae bacterium]|jgi:nitrous oxidase accessory protein|nr:nitrous oxide reductase family maturation protein NosD [Flavobacteriaceae bacterium]
MNEILSYYNDLLLLIRSNTLLKRKGAKKFIILAFFTSFSLQAATVHVGKNYPIKSIKKAISLAGKGDTILVHSGLYKEGNIVIDKKISLIGQGYPILDGEKKYEVLSIKADSVQVEGLKVIRSAYATLTDPCGIKVYNKNFVVIQNNILDDNFFGIYIQNGKNCIIKNNKLRAYAKEEQYLGNGIHCWQSDSIQIIGNTVQGHRDGIYLEFVSNSIIWRNISKDNIRYGLHFMISNDNAYITNIFMHNGAGVAVMYSNNVKMINNTFEENWGASVYGLLLKDISNSYISGNQFAKNTSAIYMDGGGKNLFEKNEFRSNGWGMQIQASSYDNVITQNNFEGNTFDMSTNGDLVLNKFHQNFWDKYEGYDLNRDGIGDVPYHPLSLFAVLTEQYPSVMLLFHSFMVMLIDKSEKILPSITPDNFVDNQPLMKRKNL